jgi:FAD-dependent urate hydroxylase
MANQSTDVDVAIIGAGPYGLSAGNHLKSSGFSVRVFGEPMDFWASKMPAGMLLRSPREASNLSDLKSVLSLEDYERASGLPATAPVSLEKFVNYGKWFRESLGEDVDRRPVERLDRESAGFKIVINGGETVRAGRVVVAAGIGPFQRKPKVFGQLPAQQVSHCYEGRSIGELAKMRIAVIGAGQSALESAALLHELGADVEVIVKNPELRWVGMHGWLHHLGPISWMLYSKFDVGPAGISRLVATPDLVYRLPLKFKDKIRTRAVRPAGARWLPPRLTNVKITTGRAVAAAETVNSAVRLRLDDATERTVDYVLLGTGYDVNISQYNFMHEGLLKDIDQINGYPRLQKGFLSSVPGLHFVGATAARSFGPLLYFVAGTEFASRQLTSHIVRNTR